MGEVCSYCARAPVPGGLHVLRQCTPEHGVQWVCDDCHLQLTGLFFVGSTWQGETRSAAQCPAGHPGPVAHPWMHGWLLCPTCAAAAGIVPPAPPPRAQPPRQLRLFER